MKKKVSIQLKNIYLPVSINESLVSQISKEELKKLLIAQVKDALTDPLEAKASLTVEKATVFEDGQLFKHEIYPGRVVRTVHNEMGIVTGVRDKKIDGEKEVSVVLPGHRIWYFSFDELYETAATFTLARCIRLEFSRKELIWHEGDSAYLKDPKGDLVPVVVGKSSRGKTLLHEVNNTSNKTKSWSVARISLNQVLTEFKDEQERNQYISSERLLESFRKYSDKDEFQFQKKGLSRQEQLKYIVTLFQNEMFELQPTLFAGANVSVKEFIKKNQQKCLDILEKLNISRKELDVQDNSAYLKNPVGDSVFEIVKSASKVAFLHKIEHPSLKGKKESLLARITLNQFVKDFKTEHKHQSKNSLVYFSMFSDEDVFKSLKKVLSHQEQVEKVAKLFGNAKLEIQPPFSVREIGSVKVVSIQKQQKYPDIIEKLNNSRKELFRHTGDSACLKVPIGFVLPLTSKTARGTPEFKQHHILPKKLLERLSNKPIHQFQNKELAPQDQIRKITLFHNVILRMQPYLSIRSHGT
ncbi:hypothetical protein [Lysinibacillus fusiformis]|uniref:hypothetical protein n=1 Tax=Lysinibacillus fusiformis TaxID=28031 RepID=UPI0018828F2E|nr:hypothetical protein [Lysinibacillus fusiformis]MBD8523848.1 hypothetical protein [Lysinibacillus fusiformis]